MALCDFAVIGKELALGKKEEESKEESKLGDAVSQSRAEDVRELVSIDLNRARSDVGTKKCETFYLPASRVEANQLMAKAHKAGWAPAYNLLKSLSHEEREYLMGKLFIKRKPGVYSEESDADRIIFSKVFGMRTRSSTALRQIGVMGRATWLHALYKVTNSLMIGPKFVFTSGDWRLPTRISEGVSRKRALEATRAGPAATTEAKLLTQAEFRFFDKLQQLLEKTMGNALIIELCDAILRAAGDENMHLFEGYLASRQARLDKLEKEEEKKKAKQTKSEKVIEVPEMDSIMIAKVLREFDVPAQIANIERVKPGFGRFFLLLVYFAVLKAQIKETYYSFSNNKAMVKKLAAVGAKDGIIGLTGGILLSTFVNPLLGLPFMFLSLTNLSLGSTELNLIDIVCMMQLRQLELASSGDLATADMTLD